MIDKPKVFFVGGFLGAGKTTAIESLAKICAKRGLKASAITNDQAGGLVDTVYLAGSGIPSEEVAGSCFCCNFNGLADAIDRIMTAAAPDVIFAEPVGSCTDIVATVIRPMRYLMQDKVDVTAYSVLVEPYRWSEMSAADAPWSMQYLFDRQLREADFIVLTKLDTITPPKAEEWMEHARNRFPEAAVVGISSTSGTGMQHWLNLVQATPPGEKWLKEIDYDKYAEAEAEMGWLNAQVRLTFPSPVDGKGAGFTMAECLSKGVMERNGRIGHLKLLAVGPTGSVKAGVTRVGEKPTLDGTFTGPLSELEITVNVRATLAPGDLARILQDSVRRFEETDSAVADVSALNTFRPGAPNPTHRYGT